jgi:hypothetical protein
MHSDAARKAKLYEIKVKGHLGPHRFRSFEKLTITMEAGGESTIAACIADQAALYGLLVRIRDLGVPLLSVRCLECTEDETDAPASRRRSGRYEAKWSGKEECDDYERSRCREHGGTQR